MKRFARRICGIALSLGMLCAAAVPASATVKTGGGSYNGQFCVTEDICEDFYAYSETGSASDYYLYSTVTYYYKTTSGDALNAGTFRSSKTKKFSSTSLDSNFKLIYAAYRHYMSEYLAVYEEVYA